MASPISNSTLHAATRRTDPPANDLRKASQPGEKPFTRSAPAEPQTSMDSPHVRNGSGKLRNERVNLDVNGAPTHLVYSTSSGGVHIAEKVRRDPAQPTAADGRSSPAPHVRGAQGTIGEPKVKVDPHGVPAHLLAVQNGEVVLARKVERKPE